MIACGSNICVIRINLVSISLVLIQNMEIFTFTYFFSYCTCVEGGMIKEYYYPNYKSNAGSFSVKEGES